MSQKIKIIGVIVLGLSLIFYSVLIGALLFTFIIFAFILWFLENERRIYRAPCTHCKKTAVYKCDGLCLECDALLKKEEHRRKQQQRAEEAHQEAWLKEHRLQEQDSPTENQCYAIIRAYGDVMAQGPTPPTPVARREAELPFPKAVIRLALAQALLGTQDEKTRDHLEIGYLQLECFLPDEEYKPFERFDSILHRVVTKRPTEEALLQVADEILEQDGPNFSKITERMEKRREELLVLRELITGALKT